MYDAKKSNSDIIYENLQETINDLDKTELQESKKNTILLILIG